MTLYTMVGIPASGKSTFSKNHSECIVVSTDEIRKELFGSAEIQTNGNLVFKTAYNRIAENLKNSDVIFDATNTTIKARKEILKRFTKNRNVAVFMNISLDECKRRNSNRERIVPEKVLERMSNRLVIPTVLEGFDEIITINA